MYHLHCALIDRLIDRSVIYLIREIKDIQADIQKNPNAGFSLHRILHF